MLRFPAESFDKALCYCPVACDFNKYSAEVSYSKFPDVSTARFVRQFDPKYQNYTLQQLRYNLKRQPRLRDRLIERPA